MANSAKLQKAYQTELQKVVDSIVHGYEPEKIIQFGSRATGNIREDSDIDLLVIKETNEPYWERNKRVTLMYRGWHPTDIFVLTPQELNQAIRDNRFMVTEEILPQGKVIYEKNN